jgi:sugar transferase (PEP-CTERM system associated)
MDLREILTRSRAHGHEFNGFLTHGATSGDLSVVGHDILGTLDRLFAIVECNNITMIAVCLENRRDIMPTETLLDFKTTMGIEVVDGHQLYEELSGRLSVDSLKPSALIFSTGFRRRVMPMLCKRLIDLVIAAFGLLVLAPVFLLCALLIKIDSRGPASYRQIRVGLRGHPFVIRKFRSMVDGAEKAGPQWAAAKDPRVSRVGRWLRKSRLDELPQLFNVLKGEMSLVGPRPERPVFVQTLRAEIPYYDLRHTVRPGITGWAQIRFRYGASAADSHTKLQYDLYYVKHLSLALDLRVLLETVRVVFLGEGARCL